MQWSDLCAQKNQTLLCLKGTVLLASDNMFQFIGNLFFSQYCKLNSVSWLNFWYRDKVIIQCLQPEQVKLPRSAAVLVFQVIHERLWRSFFFFFFLPPFIFRLFHLFPFCYCLDKVALCDPACLHTVDELLFHVWCLPHSNDLQQINAYYFLVKHEN